MDSREHIAEELLVGAYDTHIHVSPDVVPRSRNFLEAASEAREAGMAGLVFKDLAQPTVDRAYAVRALYPEIAAFGGIVLDRAAGGLNPTAVQRCLRLGGRIVWMPVAHSRQTVALYQSGALRLVNPPDIPPEASISLSSDNGKLRPEVREIVALIAEHDAILATGHISPEEAIVLVRYARSAGVSRILVNHPCGKAVAASLEQQRELASLGAFMEHCYAQCTAGLDGLPIEVIAGAIAEIGPASCILAGDLGQVFNPPPVEGLGLFLRLLEQAGIPRADLHLMTHENPRRLLGT